MIRAHIHEVLKAQPTYKKCWKGRRFAIEKLFGDWSTSVAILPRFLRAIRSTTLGTKVEWQYHTDIGGGPRFFDYVFWVFGPCIEAFKHMTKVLSVDGTHLRGPYRGKLLVASSSDANNRVLPMAFALVDEESVRSWGWFLDCIRMHIIGNTHGICLISDRHAGLLSALEQRGEWQPPMAYHRICLRHLRSNFHSKFRNATLKTLCWQAGATPQQRKFWQIMNHMKRTDEVAFN